MSDVVVKDTVPSTRDEHRCTALLSLGMEPFLIPADTYLPTPFLQ